MFSLRLDGRRPASQSFRHLYPSDGDTGAADIQAKKIASVCILPLQRQDTVKAIA